MYDNNDKPNLSTVFNDPGLMQEVATVYRVETLKVLRERGREILREYPCYKCARWHTRWSKIGVRHYDMARIHPLNGDLDWELVDTPFV